MPLEFPFPSKECSVALAKVLSDASPKVYPGELSEWDFLYCDFDFSPIPVWNAKTAHKIPAILDANSEPNEYALLIFRKFVGPYGLFYVCGKKDGSYSDKGIAATLHLCQAIDCARQEFKDSPFPIQVRILQTSSQNEAALWLHQDSHGIKRDFFIPLNALVPDELSLIMVRNELESRNPGDKRAYTAGIMPDYVECLTGRESEPRCIQPAHGNFREAASSLLGRSWVAARGLLAEPARNIMRALFGDRQPRARTSSTFLP